MSLWKTLATLTCTSTFFNGLPAADHLKLRKISCRNKRMTQMFLKFEDFQVEFLNTCQFKLVGQKRLNAYTFFKYVSAKPLLFA